MSFHTLRCATDVHYVKESFAQSPALLDTLHFHSQEASVTTKQSTQLQIRNTELRFLLASFVFIAVSWQQVRKATFDISVDLLASTQNRFSDPYKPGESTQHKRTGVEGSLLFLAARGCLGLVARQRAVEPANLVTHEIHSGDPAVAAVRAVGRKNNEHVKAARAQHKAYKTPRPLNVVQFLAFLESLAPRDDAGEVQGFVHERDNTFLWPVFGSCLGLSSFSTYKF